MKALILVCLFSDFLFAWPWSPVNRLVSSMEDADVCMGKIAKLIGQEHPRKITPPNAVERISKSCNDDEIGTLREYMSCMSEATCDWAKELKEFMDTHSSEETNPFSLITDMPRMRECPRPTSVPSPACAFVLRDD